MTQQPNTEHSPTPWAIRPYRYDDWGFVRDASGQLACIARGHDDKDDDQHRREKTDPYAANAAFIVEAVNSYAANKERIEELEKALAEAREHIAAEFYSAGSHHYIRQCKAMMSIDAALNPKGET